MNKIFVVSGPSGSGKSTLIKMLTKEHDCILFSVSHTTRKEREGEVDSEDYYFISRKNFTNMINKDLFAEWAEVHDELYGTSINEIEKKSTGDSILILDIDVQGAEIIKDKFTDSLHVFIMPPGIVELEKRLMKREKKLNSEFRKRLITAEEEIRIGESGFYDYKIINDDIDESYNKFRNIFRKYMRSVLLPDKNNSQGAGK
ncbi:MAG: guanylate kinase [Candidatus Aminicenantes bacterium]|nr:guanylate kinase [Candidatus Aminicenantes bacterium]MCK5003920.1 guanylate kinase [Candidatus Aminicenantes bacterium]